MDHVSLVQFLLGQIMDLWREKTVNTLTPLAGTEWLAGPGCLCAKQAGARQCKQTPGEGLGTRRGTSYLCTASGVGT